VKKVAALFLLSIYLFSAIQLSELLKINVLLAHYHETEQHEPKISFFDFLVMHYVTDDGNSKDNDRDSQLPFKSNSNLVTNSISTFILGKREEVVLPHIVAHKTTFQDYHEPYISSNFSRLVWNPPRIS